MGAREDAALLVADEVWQMRASDFVHVGFGESLHTVKSRLQALVVVLNLLGRNIFRYRNERTHAHESFGEGLWNQESVPGMEDPGLFQGDMKDRHGNARGSGKENRAGLGDEPRAPRSVDGECDGPALRDLSTQPEQAANGALATRSANGNETKAANHAGREF